MAKSINGLVLAGLVTIVAGGASPAADPAAVHIGDLDGAEFPSFRGGITTGNVLVMVHDAEHRPVSQARVRGSWSDGVSGFSQCETAVDGTCTLTSRRFADQQGLKLILVIRGVDGAEMEYAKTANHDVDGETNGTTFTMYR